MPKKMPLEARLDQAEALLTDDGVTLETIIGSLGMCRTQCVRIITRLCRAGRAFRFRAKLVEDSAGSAMHALFFKTESARDQYASAYQERMKLRARVRQRVHHNAWARRNPEKVRANVENYRAEAAARAREYRMRKAQERAATASDRAEELERIKHARARERDERAAANERKRAEERAMAKAMRLAEKEQAKLRARLDRDAAAAAKQREKAEAASQRKALKASTKAAGALVFKTGTVSPAPVKPRGPAMLAGEPIIPPGLEVKKLGGCPASRWDTSHAQPVVSSGECRAWARAVAA